jgi:hypothetical protein
LWADGPVCPHCAVVGKAGKLNGVKGKNGKVRIGLWKCYTKQCRKQFTVRVGTVFESAHIPLHKTLQFEEGHERPPTPPDFGGGLQVRLILAHRIREAMRDGVLAPMGGSGGIVEVDETYIGKLLGQGVRPQEHGLDLGRAGRGHSPATIVPIIRQNIRRESKLMTDAAHHYKAVRKRSPKSRT